MKKNLEFIYIRVLIVIIHDLIMAAVAFEAAILARYQILGTPQEFLFLWPATLSFVLICSITFWKIGLYRGIWHYASINDLITISKAVIFSLLFFIPIMFIFTRLESFPRSTLFILFPLLIVLLTTPRLLYRIIKDRNLHNIFDNFKKNKIQVLMYGVNDETERFIREVNRPGNSPYTVIGIIDAKADTIGRDIHGIRIWGTLENLENIIFKLKNKKHNPQKLIISNTKISSNTLKKLLEDSEKLGITVAKLPKITQFFQADSSENLEFPFKKTIQPLAVEDLLHRPQHNLNNEEIRSMVKSRKILVTGAGGTIGSEIVRQIIDLQPSELCLLDNNEFALYKIETEINELYPELIKEVNIADIRSFPIVENIFKNFMPDIVFHTAALKHVPLVENNPIEAILTNIIGTKNIANISKKYFCKTMVLISSDKAVYPSSTMGKTKRIAETYCQSIGINNNNEKQNRTKFVVVRFGNVLGSTGSVVPLFQRQIATGGPVTVTHPDATRYFMTTKEAVRLVLHASTIENDVKNSKKVFILDMGEPVKIQDLAKQLIRMEGLQPDKDIKIKFVGLRKGEKIHESLYHDQETLTTTEISGINETNIFVPDLNHLEKNIKKLEILSADLDANKALELLSEMVKSYMTKNIDKKL